MNIFNSLCCSTETVLFQLCAMKSIYVFLICLILASLPACKGSKVSGTQSSANTMIYADDFELYMKKKPCFGQCPVYEITINADGTVVYYGEMYVEKEGTFKKQLAESQFEALKQIIEETGFFELEDKYDNEMIMDLPSTVISLTNEKKHKSVESKYGAPESLKTLERKLNEIALSDYGWTKVKSADKEREK